MPSGVRVVDGEWRPNGYQQVSAMGTVKSLTVPRDTTLLLIQAEAQAVRWRDDGTNPTAAVGMVIAAGETISYVGDPHALRFIEAAVGGLLNVSYYR